jgi:hypothetical protein
MGKSKDFYDDVKMFHDKTTDIIDLVKQFKRETGYKTSLNFKYGSVRFQDGKIVENDFNLPENFRSPMEFWGKNKEKETLKIQDRILKMELGDNKIFLFKVFDIFEKKENFVLSGYIVSASVEFRLFLAKIAEREIEKRAEQLISIL